MPTEPPATPRKMLPPPMTMATSTPRFTTSATSCTMRTMVARLMPNASSPIRASPDSLSRIRLWAGWLGMDGGLLGCNGCECKLAGGGKKPAPVEPRPTGRTQPGRACAALRGLLGGSDLRRDFGGEIVDLLLDAFADHVQGEALDRGVGGLQHLLHGLLVVLHELLVQQGHFLQVLLHAALDALGNDLRGLHRLAG